MSFWKVVWAVVVANLLTGIVVSLLGLLFWLAAMSSLVSSFDGLSGFEPPKLPPATSPYSSPSDTGSGQIMKPYQVDQKQKRKPRYSESAHKRNQELCSYWGDEARKDPNPEFKAYRDAACLRVKNQWK